MTLTRGSGSAGKTGILISRHVGLATGYEVAGQHVSGVGLTAGRYHGWLVERLPLPLGGTLDTFCAGGPRNC